MVANAAQKKVTKTTSDRQHIYQINFAQALCKMKNTVVELLLFSAEKPRRKLEALMDYMACTIENRYDKAGVILGGNQKPERLAETIKKQSKSMA